MTVKMVEIFLQILILLAFGFLFSKRGIITESMKNGLSTLLLKAVLPLVILSSSQVAFDGSVLQGFVVTMAVSLVFYVVVVGGLGLVRKRIPIPDGGNRIFVLLCAYGNDGFIGIPLAMQFFGSSGMLYAIAANIVFNITLFSFGIAVLQDKAKPDIKGILLNPCLICTVVALVLYALPFRFPTPITDAFNMAGSMMTPLAMFIIGYEMSRMKLSDVVRDKWAYIVSFMRLLALPALAAVVLSFVPGIDPLVASVSVFLLAMPCGTLNVILSQQYGANPKFAARATTQSMFLFLLTVPLILILVKVLF
ncbi:MAG: AEC family transporter [Eggerthella sp.]|uniref:AEC family transporter n=1 Tax=Eggerthella lenta TaxID=84112 RepID=UPI0018AA9201|nr:AEC family transporter [Eggerthella lenta]MDB1770211.1 AEC family transporter [Eggerthella lenta]MDU5353603.1 AEC family transporter [Eggerthella sp.]